MDHVQENKGSASSVAGAGLSPTSDTHRKSTVKRKHAHSGSDAIQKTKAKVPRKETSRSEGDGAKKRPKNIGKDMPVSSPMGQVMQTDLNGGTQGMTITGSFTEGTGATADQTMSPRGPQEGSQVPSLDVPQAPEPSDLSPRDKFLLARMESMIAQAMRGNPVARQSEDLTGTSKSGARRGASTSPPHNEVDEEYSSGSDSSASESEEESKMLSADEMEKLQQPSSAGLFKAALFSTLLNKAKCTTEMGGRAPGQEVTGAEKGEAKHFLFNSTAMQTEEVPSPLLFRDTLQQQWTVPAAGQPPLASERRFYNLTEDIAKLLQPPTVDEPLVASASTDTVITGPEEALKADDRRMEQVVSRGFQMTAWAIKAATTASFFNRVTLLWLRELQARIPADNLRVHQDINKIVAATEFSADATLNATKFSGRALGTLVTSRRLVWLRHWPAEIKKKWKLASAPFVPGKLFGDALEPALVTSKDGKKRMVSTAKSGNHKKFTYNRKQSFREHRDRPSTSQQSATGRSDRQLDKGYRGRQYGSTYNNSYNTAYNNSFKRPFRGGRGKSDRKAK